MGIADFFRKRGAEHGDPDSSDRVARGQQPARRSGGSDSPPRSSELPASRPTAAAAAPDEPGPRTASGAAGSVTAQGGAPGATTPAPMATAPATPTPGMDGSTNAEGHDAGPAGVTTAGAGGRPGGRTSVAASDSGGTSRLLGALVGLAAIGLALHLMTTYASFVAPIFLTLNLMITAYPLYRVMSRHRVPRAVAAIVTGLVVIAVLALFLYGMYWSVAAMVNKLPEYSDKFNDLYLQALNGLERIGISADSLTDRVKSIDPNSIAGVAGSLLSDVGSVGSMVVVTLTALIFMMMDTPEMAERMDLARRTHGGFVDSLGAFAEGIRRYWVVATVFGLIVAILDGVVLLGLGVPLALVWAIFSFLTNYIPNVGFVIGLIPPALLALVDSGPELALAVVVAYSVLNFVVQSIIQPKVAGNAVGLTPTLSFISLLLWTAVMGPLGALLALPMSLLVKALLVDPDPRVRWVNALISSRPQDAVTPEPVEEPEGLDG